MLTSGWFKGISSPSVFLNLFGTERKCAVSRTACEAERNRRINDDQCVYRFPNIAKGNTIDTLCVKDRFDCCAFARL